VAWEWDEFVKTVRHELVHAHQFAERGQSDHGMRFKLLAQSVDAPIHCQSFTTGRLQLRCGEGCEDHRSKASKLVKHPETVRCRPHDASMTVKHVATGRTWTDNEGYERQRAAIEDEDDAPSYAKAALVERLLDRAFQFVDIGEVMFDRGFYSNDVYAAVADRGLMYLSPVPKDQDDYEAIADIDGLVRYRRGEDFRVCLAQLRSPLLLPSRGIERTDNCSCLVIYCIMFWDEQGCRALVDCRGRYI
jgi:hypothetical protein